VHPAAVEQNFRTRAERLTGWGIALLGVAALLWCYAAWQVFTPDRDWPRPVTALVLATPLATVGGVLLATGTVTTRLRRHQDDLERATRD
jgi:protein-S-isoprenylcysteine O-methyltransferase Ste14